MRFGLPMAVPPENTKASPYAAPMTARNVSPRLMASVYTLARLPARHRDNVAETSVLSWWSCSTYLRTTENGPRRFDGELHGRGWLQDFFGWHNDDHHHSSLALFTPSDVFFGRVALVATARQAALNLAYRAHPERFPHGAPRVALPPAAVHINPLTADALQLLAGPATPEETSTPTSIMNSRLRVRAALRRQAPVAAIAT